jgi:hypothetical protein
LALRSRRWRAKSLRSGRQRLGRRASPASIRPGGT